VLLTSTAELDETSVAASVMDLGHDFEHGLVLENAAMVTVVSTRGQAQARRE